MKIKNETISAEIEYDHFVYLSCVDDDSGEDPMCLLWTDLSSEEKQAFERLLKEGVSICERLLRLYLLLQKTKKHSRVA